MSALGIFNVAQYSVHRRLTNSKLKKDITGKWFGNKQEEEMPEENPPPIIRTPDGIEWQFLKTFSDFDQINKFRHKHQCQATKDKKDSLRIRFYCRRRNKDDCKCKFTLMTLKTHNGGYHVYKHGEHGNHPTLIRRLYRYILS
jgi:hypothetical protein